MRYKSTMRCFDRSVAKVSRRACLGRMVNSQTEGGAQGGVQMAAR
jgi:hypothetical protein